MTFLPGSMLLWPTLASDLENTRGVPLGAPGAVREESR